MNEKLVGNENVSQTPEEENELASGVLKEFIEKYSGRSISKVKQCDLHKVFEDRVVISSDSPEFIGCLKAIYNLVNSNSRIESNICLQRHPVFKDDIRIRGNKNGVVYNGEVHLTDEVGMIHLVVLDPPNIHRITKRNCLYQV